METVKSIPDQAAKELTPPLKELALNQPLNGKDEMLLEDDENLAILSHETKEGQLLNVTQGSNFDLYNFLDTV